jgi:hypothetical protein
VKSQLKHTNTTQSELPGSGISMDHSWIIHGLSMDYPLIIHGSSIDYAWIFMD